jgi:AcrR family transcriptional regulator
MPPFSNDPCLFRRRRKEARPAELLEAALTLFVEKGFAATRSEEVAKAAGVSKGTLYLYFPSKEELLKAVIQHFLGTEIETGIQEAAGADGPTAQIMQQLLVNWWTRIYEGPASGVFKLVITEVRNFPEIGQFWVERVVAPGQEIVSGLLRRGVARGEFAVEDVESAVHSILMPMILLCVHKHSFAACGIGKEMEIDPVQFMHSHLRLIFAGLQAPPRRPTPPPDGPPPSPLRI